jgi:Domain of unknown function DUF29
MAIHPNLHDQDFYAWALRNAALLRDGRFSEIDIEHVAEELESMGRSERRELVSRLAILFAHLLKWAHQSGRQSASWRNTIKVQRLDARSVLADNPSLQAQADAIVSAAYEKGKLLAANETGFDERSFPERCPWTIEQALDPDYWPDPTHVI